MPMTKIEATLWALATVLLTIAGYSRSGPEGAIGAGLAPPIILIVYTTLDRINRPKCKRRGP